MQDKTTPQWLSAPETVHWAVTYRCSKDCPECYTMRFRHAGTELSLEGAIKVVEKLAKWGVFQLAIGGGEPFEKEGLPDIVSRATASGLVVHATTGIKDFRYKDISPYAGNIRNIQIGLSTHDLSLVSYNDLKNPLANTIRVVKDAGISPGVNIILTKQVLRNFDTILESIVSSGVERIVFIRFKPPDSRKLWQREKPDQDQLLFLQRKITSIRKKYPEVELRTDCALSFLQRYIPESLSKYAGLKGCVAGDRILAISPGGDMYPCSQLVSEAMNAGNILRDDLQEVWDKSTILRKYRFFRNGSALKDSWCGVCSQKDSCGGCRVFAHDAVGGDPGCPEP
ncbi:MAG: radical SAM protein, partial [Bacteroidales bacterium]|nr:radical SAM protein [Bacteroidales bacterium]